MNDRALPEYRLRMDFQRPDREVVAKFLKLPVAAISDSMYKRNTLSTLFTPAYRPFKQFAGPAFTVQTLPGDELLALKAIETAQPGDVIVVAGTSQTSCALWGGIMTSMAKARGITALVTDGLVRDVNEIRGCEFPVFCQGITPVAPVMDSGSGDMNFPVALGGVVVNPGDIVVGGEDGVVIVPQDLAINVVKAVEYRIQKENRWLERIQSGKEMILSGIVEDLLSKRTVQVF
ncbi:MAG TPA: RraA family protein [Bacillota bacterium]|nr:RraA family protein [Bacillota bacterium]